MDFEKKISAIHLGRYKGPKLQSAIMRNNYARMIAHVNLILVIWFFLKIFVGRKMALSMFVVSSQMLEFKLFQSVRRTTALYLTKNIDEIVSRW